MIYFYSHIFCKTVLIYYVHQTICFGTMMKLFIFISFKLLKLGCYRKYEFIFYLYFFTLISL